MRRIKLVLLCLTASVVVMSCKKEEKQIGPKPDVVDNPVIDTLSGTIYTETIADINFSMDMVYVQGGTFNMGTSERYNGDWPVHKVTLSSYQISKYEITQAQYKAVMLGTNPSRFKDDNLPVDNVAWDKAKEFCERLSAKTGKKYVLPTEAQWEFAARGGNKSKGYVYSGSNTLGDVAWYEDNSAVNRMSVVHAVGTKAPNELGIYDMSGNEAEWCSDWWAFYSKEDDVTDPIGPSNGGARVIRGGSYLDDSVECKVSARDYGDERTYGAGFRVVCIP